MVVTSLFVKGLSAETDLVWNSDLGVSKNRGYPQIMDFNRVFHEINYSFWGPTPHPNGPVRDLKRLA